MREHEAEVRANQFTYALAAIALAGLLLRVLYIVLAKDQTVGGDGRYYHSIAGLLVDGKGFIAPEVYARFGQSVATSPHPPAWPLALAGPALVGLRSVFEQQLFACVIGAATVVLVGCAGRQLAGPRVGLLAAAAAAVYPNFWLYERELMSETLTLFGAALLVLCVYRFIAQPSALRAAAVGGACGLLALTHADTLVFVVILLAPLTLLTPRVPARQRVAWTAVAVGITLVVIAPWALYNSTRFDEPVLLGTQFGVTVAISNCDATYYGKFLGFQEDACADAAVDAGKVTEVNQARLDNEFLDVGLDYARAHAGRALVVVAAREGRTWSVFRPAQQMRFDQSRRTRHDVIVLGFLAYWMLLPAAVAGLFLLHRRGVPLWPLLTFFVVVAVAAAVTYGFTRFRAVAEVPIVLLAAVTVDAVITPVCGWLMGPSAVARPGDREPRPEHAPPVGVRQT